MRGVECSGDTAGSIDMTGLVSADRTESPRTGGSRH
jgi:hypothetical protein